MDEVERVEHFERLFSVGHSQLQFVVYHYRDAGVPGPDAIKRYTTN